MSSQLSFISALIVLVIFAILSVFQLLLALGKPYGKMAYGGRQDEILPTKYRIMSGLAIVLFVIASLFVLVKIEIVKNCPIPDIANLGIWFFAFYLALNTLANITSKSDSERKFMTPLSFIACICLFILALGL